MTEHGEEQPSPGEQEARRSFTVEDLIKRRQDLERRGAEINRKKEEDIAKKLTEREAMVEEDKRIVPLLEEANRTLEEFETQNEQGLFTEEKDKADLEELRAFVSDLRTQREAALQKYRDIMQNEDVSGKVWEEAHIEEISREFIKEIEQWIKEMCDDIVEYATQRGTALKEREDAGTALYSAKGELQQIIGDAMQSLDYKQDETRDFLNRVSRNISNGTGRLVENVKDIEERRRGLGFLKFKEKSALDSVLEKGSKFTELDKLKGRVDKAEKSLKDVESRVVVFQERYRVLVSEIREKLHENANSVIFKVMEGLRKGLNEREAVSVDFKYIFEEVLRGLDWSLIQS